MSSQWTNKYAIIRDLSLAQGREVPVDLSVAVSADEKPPALNIPEETEEEFYNNGVEDDNSTGPDFSLIQHMLKMIHNTSDSEDENSVIQISKPVTDDKKDTTLSEVKCDNNNSPENAVLKIEVMKKPKKRRVNVALNSILQGLLVNEQVPDTKVKPEPMKLLKPTDFMAKDEQKVKSEKNNQTLQDLQSDNSTNVVNSFDKVNNWLSLNCESSPMTNSLVKVNEWLDSNKSGDTKQKNKLFDYEPTAMFRKKSLAAKSLESDSVESIPVKKDEKKEITMFQPSSLADEYYKKFVEQSKIKEIIKEDVWTKAERVMKEIDAKKTKETEAVTINPYLDGDSVTSCDEILLPQHRHLLTGDCIVCEIVKKHGINIDLEILQNEVHNAAPKLKWRNDS